MRAAPLALVLLAGCDGGGPDGDPHPAALDLPERSVEALARAEPGRCNVTATVASLLDCPRDALCLIPSSVTLGPALGPAPEPFVATIPLDDAGRLFRAGRRYLFSVEVERSAPPAVTLLGVSPR